MNKILIVCDDKLVSKYLKDQILIRLNIDAIIAYSLEECKKVLVDYEEDISISLLDFVLPDAKNGEIIEYINKFNIPSIILTSSSKQKEHIFENESIIDYVIKDNTFFAYDYAVEIIQRIIKNKNKNKKVLVVNKSKTMAESLKNLLLSYQLQVIVSYDVNDALEVFKNNKDISLVYIDCDKSNMNNLELLKSIRMDYGKDEKSIITITDSKDTNLVSMFLKYGSNDFLYKEFTNEEFYARLNSSLEILDLFEEIRNKANKDFLTGAYNRRYFFSQGSESFLKYKNTKMFMIDIDKFKKINDTYGHNIGDIAIKEVISILNKSLKGLNCIISRFGGEEFCVLVFEMKNQEFLAKLEDIRNTFENNIIKTKEGDVRYTISIGYCLEKLESLDQMILSSDNGLYKAKNSGRNQIRA